MIMNTIRFNILMIAIGLLLPHSGKAQSHNYWTRSFNEESSLLSGAVVGGGSGPTSIYYNPANISEVQASSFSVNASLFTIDFINRKNALGEDINLSTTKLTAEPRFLSFMVKSKKHPSLCFELAYLNNENAKVIMAESVDKRIDILTQTPGVERYFAVYNYRDEFRDDWLCFGSSIQLNEKLYIGIGVYIIVKSLNYSNSLDIETYSTNDTVGSQYYPNNLAVYQKYQFLKFNDYRINGKLGIAYKARSLSIGLTISSPSIGGIYSDGKRVTHKESQINIHDPNTGEPVPSYTIIDFKEKSEMDVSFKTPFSVAAGLTYRLPDGKRTFYSSVEYFSGLEPYRMVEADESEDIASGSGFSDLIYTEWLTIVSGARPVFNAAVGYSWTLKKDLLLMAGFRTDFNYEKNLDLGELTGYNRVENINLDLYYITCGLSWNVLGQDIITGLQYTVGRTKGEKQIANLSDPVEYSPVEQLALQGDRSNDMISLFNSISIYFGASFNFGGEGK